MWTDILFDLDGTLTDPAEGITGSVRCAMEALSYPVPEQHVLERFIGPPLDEAFREICGFDDAQIAQAVETFRVYFRQHGIHQNEIFPGMAALLADLKAAGRTLHLATTKPLPLALEILDNFEIRQYFDVTAGSDLNTHAGRPKGEIVREVLDTAAIPPEKAVMVGDRKHDVIGAHQCGVPCVGVLFGYGGRPELEAAGADYIVPDINGLRAVLLG